MTVHACDSSLERHRQEGGHELVQLPSDFQTGLDYGKTYLKTKQESCVRLIFTEFLISLTLIFFSEMLSPPSLEKWSRAINCGLRGHL